MYKTSRLVRICLLISALNKRVLLFSSGKLFYKSNWKLFPCVCISWYKHSRGWESSRQLCKLSTSSWVCITVSNSPNLCRVHIRLCKHGKLFYCLSNISRPRRSVSSLDETLSRQLKMRVFLTNFEGFHLVMKHCVECLILFLKQNRFSRRN